MKKCLVCMQLHPSFSQCGREEYMYMIDQFTSSAIHLFAISIKCRIVSFHTHKQTHPSTLAHLYLIKKNYGQTNINRYLFLNTKSHIAHYKLSFYIL